MIREAVIEDAEAIAKIICSAWKSAFSGIVERAYVETMSEELLANIFKGNISDRKETIFVKMEEGRIAGFVSGVMHKPDSEIIGLYVDPAYQRQGIGEELFNAIKENFRANGCTTIHLTTLKGAANNSFYKRVGGVLARSKRLRFGMKDYAGVEFLWRIN